MDTSEMSTPLRYVIRKKFEHIAWKSRLLRKWGSVVYLHRAYGYTYRELLVMYRESVAAYVPGSKSFLGFEQKDVSGMYKACAKRRYTDDHASRA